MPAMDQERPRSEGSLADQVAPPDAHPTLLEPAWTEWPPAHPAGTPERGIAEVTYCIEGSVHEVRRGCDTLSEALAAKRFDEDLVADAIPRAYVHKGRWHFSIWNGMGLTKVGSAIGFLAMVAVLTLVTGDLSCLLLILVLAPAGALLVAWNREQQKSQGISYDTSPLTPLAVLGHVDPRRLEVASTLIDALEALGSTPRTTLRMDLDLRWPSESPALHPVADDWASVLPLPNEHHAEEQPWLRLTLHEGDTLVSIMTVSDILQHEVEKIHRYPYTRHSAFAKPIRVDRQIPRAARLWWHQRCTSSQEATQRMAQWRAELSSLAISLAAVEARAEGPWAHLEARTPPFTPLDSIQAAAWAKWVTAPLRSETEGGTPTGHPGTGGGAP